MISKKPRSTHQSYLPQHIIQDILTRLPVKSLTRFKCVSKPWSTLIKSLDFTTAHLHISTQNPSILICRWHSRVDSNSKIVLLQNEAKLLPLKIPFMTDSMGLPNIVGSSNGLICLDITKGRSKSAFVLWNPATTQWKYLPPPLMTGSDVWKVPVGFGYAREINDFKLVRIVHGGENRIRAEVYTWSTGIWREIEHVDITTRLISRRKQGVAIKGVLHWLAIDSPNTLRDPGSYPEPEFIVSFDIANEVFKSIPMPEFEVENNFEIVSYKESLALIVYPYYKPYDWFELWVMNDYGDDGGVSWDNIFTIMEPYPLYLLHIESWEDCEEITKFMDPNTRTLLFHPGNQDTREFRFPRERYYNEVFTYVESLVPVDGGGN